MSDNEYDDLLLDAYRGEIFGDAFFGTLAEAQPDPSRREKLLTLQTVEARTATSLRRLVTDAGIRLGDTAADARREGAELARTLDPESWHNLMDGLSQTLPDFLAKFERLRALSPRRDPALDALVNHEQAIEAFVQLELDGNEKKSMKPLHDHLRRPA